MAGQDVLQVDAKSKYVKEEMTSDEESGESGSSPWAAVQLVVGSLRCNKTSMSDMGVSIHGITPRMDGFIRENPRQKWMMTRGTRMYGKHPIWRWFTRILHLAFGKVRVCH